ncbi:unnamed protein product [Colias eurytheme]|nr:unnamed protein product [Colias eurytheme]
MLKAIICTAVQNMNVPETTTYGRSKENEIVTIRYSPEYKFIRTSLNRTPLMIDGYTFLKSSTRNKGIRSITYLCTRKNSGCKARVHLTDDGKLTVGVAEHTHARAKYHVSSDDFRFITLVGDKKLLMVDGYTFSQMTPKHWYCSQKSKGCKAKIHLGKDEKSILLYEISHDHKPPKYVTSGKYHIKNTSYFPHIEVRARCSYTRGLPSQGIANANGTARSD